MFKFNFRNQSKTQTAFCLSDTSYSVATVDAENNVLLNEFHDFKTVASGTMASHLSADVKRLGLLGQKCRLILTPNQYKLVVMDAVDVPEAEMAKALKWRLKGLIEYPINDIALDAFLIPPHGVAKQQKKAFVAVTLLSKLREKLALFESAFIEIVEVGIAELALQKICNLLPIEDNRPIIVISLEEENCQLQVIYNQQLYLVRGLQLPTTLSRITPAHEQNTLLEVQRSIDYCLSALKIPEPHGIFFTPGFEQAPQLLEMFKTEQAMPVHLMDLNNLLRLKEPLALKDQQQRLYSIGGALTAPKIDNPVAQIEELA